MDKDLIHTPHPLRIGHLKLDDPGLINYMPMARCSEDHDPIFPGPPQAPPAQAHEGLWYLSSRKKVLADEDVRVLCEEARRLGAPGISLRALPAASLRHLHDLPALRYLSLSCSPINDEGLHVLAGLRGLEWLDLYGTQVSDAGIVHLRGLPRLRTLNLSSTAVTGACLPHLAELPALADLSLRSCRIDERSLLLLTDLPALRRLDLSLNDHSDVALAALAGLTELEVLHVGSKHLTGYGLRHLAGLGKLRALGVSGMREVLGHLRRLRHLPLETLDLSDAELRSDSLSGLFGHPLRSLCLFGVALDDEGFKHLGGLPELRRFRVFGHKCKVTSRSMTYLALCSRLEELSLDDLGVGDLGLYRLARLGGLRRLDLSRTLITEDGVRVIGALSGLRELELTVCDLHEESLSCLAALPHLERLRLGAYNSDLPWRPRPKRNIWGEEEEKEIHEPAFHWVTDRGMQHIGALRGLTWLELPWSYVTDEGLRHLRGLQRLQRLRIGGLFTGPGLRHLAGLTGLWDLHLDDSPICGRYLGPVARLPRILSLSLRRTQVDDEGLRRHVSRMASLRYLCLDGAPVTPRGLRHVAGLPNLLHLWLRDLRLPSAEMRALQEQHPLLEISPSADEFAQMEQREREEARWRVPFYGSTA
jgi:Leucine-rich repeat (LRR) protein